MYNINTEKSLAFASGLTATHNLLSESWLSYIVTHNRKQSKATSTQQKHLQNNPAACSMSVEQSEGFALFE